MCGKGGLSNAQTIATKAKPNLEAVIGYQGGEIQHICILKRVRQNQYNIYRDGRKGYIQCIGYKMA